MTTTPVFANRATISSAAFRADIDGIHPLSPAQIERFRANGYLKLRDVFSRDTLEFYGRVITDEVRRLNKEHRPMEKRDLYGRAFLQVMNIWTKSVTVRDFVFGKKLARLAAELLEVDGVRLYHDQALYKEPGGGITPWHADQFYWPLDTDRTVTVWIPLQDTPLEMGPLAFAPKSHLSTTGRDVAISAESEALISRTLQECRMEVDETAYELGEVSFHLGWNWHRAGANRSVLPRRVMTIIYMEQDARLLEPRHENHRQDLAAWMPGAGVGEIINTPLNPVLWSRRNS